MNYHFSGAQRNMEGSIDIPYSASAELPTVFRRSGFANVSYLKRGFRFLPCATGMFVNSSYSYPTCEECPAGKIHYSMTKLRENPCKCEYDAVRVW